MVRFVVYVVLSKRGQILKGKKPVRVIGKVYSKHEKQIKSTKKVNDRIRTPRTQYDGLFPFYQYIINTDGDEKMYYNRAVMRCLSKAPPVMPPNKRCFANTLARFPPRSFVFCTSRKLRPLIFAKAVKRACVF